MFRRRRTVRCPANVWTKVLDTPFAQMPVTWTLHLDAAGAPVAGEFEERATRWVLPADPVRGPLQPRMTFTRGYWNTFYVVRFRPTVDLVVTIE
jgi:hypothetical protein